MSKTTLALLTANAFLFAFAFMGFASTDTDVFIVTAMLTMAMAVINGIAHYRNRSKHSAPRNHRRAPDALDEMDARTVLDIDARLEALERREREMEDAERIRAMAARGELSAFDEPLAEAEAVSGLREHA